MGFMDELKKLARPYAEDEDDFDDDFDLDERPRASRASTAPRAAARSTSLDDAMDDMNVTPARPTRRTVGDSTHPIKTACTYPQRQRLLICTARSAFHKHRISTIKTHMQEQICEGSVYRISIRCKQNRTKQKRQDKSDRSVVARKRDIK